MRTYLRSERKTLFTVALLALPLLLLLAACSSSSSSPAASPAGNSAPVAVDGAVTTDEDTPVNGTLSASDTDGDDLTYSIQTSPTSGTAVITDAATGAYTYTPAANFNGSDSFTFIASDASLDSNAATVTVTVTAVNDTPTADAGTDQTVDEGSAVSLSNFLAKTDL